MRAYNNIALQGIVDLAVRRFFERDVRLLQFEAHEQAVAHRVAHYMELILNNTELDIDCEYNKHLKTDKRIKLDVDDLLRREAEMSECGCTTCQDLLKGVRLDRFENKLFRPDIIVHQRGTDNLNVIAIEIKKERRCPFDQAKLRALINPAGEYKYQVGSYINLQIEEPSFTWFLRSQS